MGPEDLKMLRETHRLALENNAMLRKMRRSAFVHTLFRLIIYAAFILGPIWFYYAYLAAPMQQLVDTVQSIQGVSSDMQGKYQSFNQAIMNVISSMPGISHAPASSSLSQ